MWKILLTLLYFCSGKGIRISGMILFSLLIPGFSADQETALLGYGIFTDRLGNTSWSMLAKDFQSMLHKNMLALSVNFKSISVLIILNISVILLDLYTCGHCWNSDLDIQIQSNVVGFPWWCVEKSKIILEQYIIINM